MVIRACEDSDFFTIGSVINEGARAYRGVIPQDRLSEPYMDAEHLRHEIEAGVQFFSCEEDGDVLGVMGIQSVQDVILIRHAYVRTASQGRGIGSMLLNELRASTVVPMLVGAWEDATWAIRFYERHGFRMVDPIAKVRLLRQYWTVPERQIETSVVLGDNRWWKRTETAV